MTRKILLLILVVICLAGSLSAQNLSGVRIYINPGHGGYDSDDRNVVIAPFTARDPNGFWESKSNLHKGLMLKELLDAAHATTRISRVTNTTADDLPLSQIVASANAFNADFMLSIHSNAGGLANHVLMLYTGVDPGDTRHYKTPYPAMAKSRAISEVIAKNLYANEINAWAYPYTLRGDKSAAYQWFGWTDGYGVLRGLTVPGIISEGSMHDYIPETYRLMNMDYKYLEAWNFFKSFAAYFKSEEVTHGLIAGAVRDRFLPHSGNYPKIAKSKDLFEPLNRATVKLVERNETYTTDDMNNGVFVFKNLPAGNYTLQISCEGYHPASYPVTVTQNKISYVDARLNRVRNTPPAVVDYSPQVGEGASVSVMSKISIKFNWDIDPESARKAFRISPEVPGTFSFKASNYVMEFTPTEPMQKGTLHTVTLDKSLKHYDGLTMTEDFTFSFTTKNRDKLELINSYPAVGSAKVHFENPTLTFVFDRRLKTANLNDKVLIYDKQGKLLNRASYSTKNNEFGPSYGSTAFRLSKNLIPNENYTAKIIKGMIDVDNVVLRDTIVIPFTAVDERKTAYPVILDFETSGLLEPDKSSSINVTSISASRSNVQKIFGSYSYNIKYVYTGLDNGEAIYRFKTPSAIDITNDSIVGMHIYGDFSGNELYLLFTADGDRREVKLDSIDYGGWKYAEMVLKDGLLPNVPYRLDGYKVVQTSAPLSRMGSLFVDNAVLYGSASPSSLNRMDAKAISVYPNPVTDVLYVRTAGEGQPWLQLYSLNGILLKAAYANHLEVGELSSGTYLLKVKTANGVFNRVVMIAK